RADERAELDAGRPGGERRQRGVQLQPAATRRGLVGHEVIAGEERVEAGRLGGAYQVSQPLERVAGSLVPVVGDVQAQSDHRLAPPRAVYTNGNVCCVSSTIQGCRGGSCWASITY